MDIDPLQRLRSLSLALPETTERLSHGEPAWFVRDKLLFVTYSDHHHDDRLAFWYAAPEGVQSELVAADPDSSSARPTSATAAGWGFAWTWPWTGRRSPSW